MSVLRVFHVDFHVLRYNAKMRNSTGSLLKIAEFSLGFETFAKIVRIHDI